MLRGAVMLRPIRFQCVGVWISAGFPMNIDVYLTACVLHSDLSKIGLEPDIPQRNYCVRRGETVY